MADMTKKYITTELETYQNKLEDAEARLERQNSWVIKGDNILNAYFEKCAAFKRLIIAPIVGVTSTLISTVAIIVLKDIIPGILPFFGLEGVNVVVLGGSTLVFIKNLERYNRKKEIINESHRFAPCEFEKFPNGELIAACGLEKDKEKVIRIEENIKGYQNDIKILETIYNKLVEEEKLEETEQVKQNEIKEQLDAECEVYPEETSQLNSDEVDYQDGITTIEPVQLKKTSSTY